MSERYWITEVQLGLLAMKHNKTRAKIVQQIVDKQFLGNVEEVIVYSIRGLAKDHPVQKEFNDFMHKREKNKKVKK